MTVANWSTTTGSTPDDGTSTGAGAGAAGAAVRVAVRAGVETRGRAGGRRRIGLGAVTSTVGSVSCGRATSPKEMNDTNVDVLSSSTRLKRMDIGTPDMTSAPRNHGMQ